jgi:hypothetical protein
LIPDVSTIPFVSPYSKKSGTEARRRIMVHYIRASLIFLGKIDSLWIMN